MWYVRVIFTMFILLVALWFGYWNQDQKVSIKMIPYGRVVDDVPLFFALLVAFAIGMLTWIIISLFRNLRLHHDLRRARRESDRLRDELKALRNLPMRDISDTGDMIEAEESETVP